MPKEFKCKRCVFLSMHSGIAYCPFSECIRASFASYAEQKIQVKETHTEVEEKEDKHGTGEEV